MRTNRSIFVFLLSMMSTLMALAQEVIVTVTPVQQVLPPQVMLYIADPGKYFNISLTNTSSQPQDVYLSLQVQQVSPASGLTISTPSKRQPATPFTIPANGVKQLTMTEIKTMFNHIPSNEIMGTPGLVGDYMNGSFGLLPEGQYKAVLTAYRWTKPQLAKPVVVSSPMGGTAYFTVCYKAQAPQFLMPMAIGPTLADSNVASLEALNPMFTWTQPVVACNPAISSYKYSIKIVEVLKNQHPVEAIERNPVVYKRDNLMAPQCIIPQNILTSQFYTDRTYAAQVTATSTTGGALNYVMIENEGKSTYHLFKIKTSDTPGGDTGEDEDDDPGKKDDPSKKGDPGKKDDPGEKDDKGQGGGSGGDKKGDDKGDGGEDDPDFIVIEGLSGGINPDSLYTFSYPTIEKPIFQKDGGARKMFTGAGMRVEWIASSHLGGEGKKPNSIEIAYDVEMFRNDNFDLEAALASQPIYKKRTKELTDSIPWQSIKQHVETGNYLVLRVKPVVVKGSSVAFGGEEKHIRDFALVELLSKKYFQCSNMINITNTKPTTKKAADYKGKTIPIGQYQLTIDEIQAGAKKDTWKGKGHVLWEPMGYKVHVCVEFDDLQINTDDIVFAGTAKSYSKNKITSNIDVVDKLFSDWGIDNLISDTGIPYANELQGVARDKVKDLAKKIDLKKYYDYVKKGNAINYSFLKGEVKDLYMPLSIPKSINKSPVDIQIAGMKFSAEYATMDLIGEFTLPNTSYTKNDILVLGAPRICISPDRILPESGTIALLSDFTINDPKSSYEMTFKAPKNVIEPENGCYVSWHAEQFEMLGIDVDMKIPGLVKDKNGTATSEKPVFNARASISDWDDWMVDNITVDPFQATALPGWTFTASDIVYDHSYYRNSTKMGTFPTDYSKSKAGITTVVTNAEGKSVSVSGNNSWQGLYIKEIAVKFPKALEFGTTGDKRLNISAQNMFFDKSGATLDIAAGNIISANTGKAGGWSFSLDKVYLSFIQNDFSKCGFSGKFSVPLLSGQIAYDCNIYRLTNNTSNSNQYAYIFKTKQVDGLSLDFFLGQATFKKDQTYFLLESTPNGNTQDTRVELLLGGDITIGGTDYLNKKIKDSSLPLKFAIPGVHFCGMRLANCANKWTSSYEKTMQSKAKNAKLSGIQLYAGKEIVLASDKIYFHTGKWSLASEEKKIGPFEFSLKKYDFKYSNKILTADLEGTITLISGISLSATAGIAINANVTLPSDLTKLNDIKISYKNTDFKKAGFDSEFAGVSLSGSLTVEKNDKTKEGYTGTLKFRMPGDLFTVDATGGYYKYQSNTTNFRYGFFNMKMSSATGLRMDPVVLNSISGGFYYNCTKKSATEATPKNGVIGVIAGLELSTTAGQDALNGSFDMTVVYDKSNNRLTTFMFNGSLKAVNGLVNSTASIVYQNNTTDKYFALNLTVDAQADGAKLAKSYASRYSTELSSLQSKMESLNSSWKPAVSNAEGGLKGKIDDTSNSNSGHKTAAKGGDSSVKASAGATVTLDFKVTMKEKGKNLSKAKWHVYLGEPDVERRCSFTLIDFKSGIVNVKIGANCYLCVGNELPGNGNLPDIPTEISNFLDGSTQGSGVQSDDISKANSARTQALKDFNADAVGGVMLGAQVYGYIDVDLGIFYGNMGATAGFDISLRKLADNASCTNLKGVPGWNRWYGEGQLYAYLYAKFGIHINLGFWDRRLPIVDAGIGGVLRMGGPKPTYFTGKARCKLKLLGGLVNINRSFQFECGDRCDLFLGNALDNFKLFGDCSIGDTIMAAGWNSKNKLDPHLLSRPFYATEAPLSEHFRVLDETELNRLARDYSGNKEDLKSQASRTFVFRTDSYVKLYEYSSATKSSKNLVSTKYFYLKGNHRINHFIDMLELNPNRYYMLEVSGWAKEILKGTEVDPLKWNEKKGRYENVPWRQTMNYYFCTGSKKALPDCPNLEEHIAIAYPSYFNKVLNPEELGDSWARAYTSDVEAPTIALKSGEFKDKCFKKGTLKWRLYDKYGKLLDEVNNSWAASDRSLNMEPQRAFKDVKDDARYTIKLVYLVSSSANNKVTTTTTDLVSLRVHTYKGSWSNGYELDGKTYQMHYEKPFVGVRINSVKFKYDGLDARYSDKRIAEANGVKINGTYARLFDPYLYISYLSNFAFVGGWELTTGRLGINATTSQSCIYTDKGGVFEGVLGKGVSYNIYDSYKKIRSLSIFDASQWASITSYPLPIMDNAKYDYVYSNQFDRASKYTPASSYLDRVIECIYDMRRVYIAAQGMSNLISSWANTVQCIGGSTFITRNADNLEAWADANTGMYLEYTHGKNVSLEIPTYQLPILWGSQFENINARKKVTMWGSFNDMKKTDERPHEKISEEIWYSFMGGQMGHKATNSKGASSFYRDKEVFTVTNAMLKNMTSANFSFYRVNMYDYIYSEYGVINGLKNGWAYDEYNCSYPLTYKW